MAERSPLSPDRFFSAEPAQRKIARQLYDSVLNLPILCPCLNPRAWVEPEQDLTSADPCELLVLSDDYLVRHLAALGVNLNQSPGTSSVGTTALHRKIWQSLGDNLFTLHGLPADIWLSEILFSVFNVREKLNGKNAMRIYDILTDSLKQPDFYLPRLVERFNIECLGLLESPTNPTINLNRSIEGSSKIIPCFNPDPLFGIQLPGWREQIDQLSRTCQIPITDYHSFLRAVQKQRLFFKSLGATTVVQSVFAGAASPGTPAELEMIFTRGICQEANADDARKFSNHLLLEMAAMSIEDNMVLQVQLLNTCAKASSVYTPLSSSFTELLNSSGFKSLIEQFGQDPQFTLIIIADDMILSERFLALAARFPAIKIGTPRWIFNGLGSIQNHFDTCLEAIGIHKSAGLTNRYSSFLSLPSQHDTWRRSCANWLAKLVVYGLLDLESAYEMVYALAYGQAKTAYKL